MNIKKFLIIATILLGLVVVGVYVFVMSKNNPRFGNNQNIQNTTTGDVQKSIWANYTNTKYGYKIKYPADWVVEVDGVVVWNNQVSNPELGNSIMFFGTKTEPYGQTERTLWNIQVFISQAENPKKLSIHDWYVEQPEIDSYGDERKFNNVENITFKGLPALKVTGNPGDGYSFLVAKGSTIYRLDFNFEKFNDGEFLIPPEEIFLEMLDSFILN